ncbi:MAG: T9SS type A sorting domain-containing protein [Bacteroidales bacterium]|nr:T9SS type A sorting domain-containing protein [Bacteroidales bacterium]
MSKYLILLLLVLPALAASGQANEFKTKEKKNGIPVIDMPVAHLQPVSSGRTAAPSTTHQVKTLVQPVLSSSKERATKVIRHKGRTVFIEKESAETKAAPEERLYRFLDETKAWSGINDPRESFKIADIRTDGLGITHIRTVQQFRGVDIYGAEATIHLDGTRERFTGDFHRPDRNTRTTPSVSAATAIRKVVGDVSVESVYRQLSQKEQDILDYSAPSTSLVLYSTGEDNYRLAWAVTIRPNFIEEWKYFIDAANGEIIHKFNNTCSDGPVTAQAYDLNNVLQTISTYLESGIYYLINISEYMFNGATDEGAILTLDANNTSTSDLDYSYVASSDNTWSQKNAVSAHNHATLAYRYLWNTFGRNSINGRGGNIISFVNVAEDDGTSMENAFWNGKAVFYGNGGSSFYSLAGALDVAAHELGHGVVSNTANLEYYGQSGAINESYADIFGSMVDRDDWRIGEDITRTSYSPSGALRDMADPHNGGTSLSQPYWQPKSVSEMYTGSQDNGGVHINSSIGNHAYYLYATAVTKEKAEQVFYKALTDYLTMTSKFIDFRIAVVQAATDLFGASSTEVAKAEEAFTAVGIQQEEQVEKIQDYAVNAGEEFLLNYNTSSSYAGTLYRTSGTNDASLTLTEMKGKVSVTDDGSLAVFVSTDSKLRGLSPDNVSDPDEFIVSNQEVWDNVAISKDGNRIAAISIYIDTAIYLFDFGGAVVRDTVFKLYNPTTSHYNTTAGGVLYADAIEFDITGQYLIYDSYNELTSSTGEDIGYWDIGIINVWNNNQNDWGDGSISKLYGSLPEDISIGNPVFSKNSPWIIAFDYIDAANGEYAILGADLNAGQDKLITMNNTLGYPSFSKNDDKIAFTKTDGLAESIYSIGLDANKISPVGTASRMIADAKWPVFFATGARDLALPPVADFTVDIKTGNAPLQVKFFDLSANQPSSWAWTFEGGTPASSTEQNPVISYNTPGTFKVSLAATNNQGSNTNTRNGYIIISAASAVAETGQDAIMIYPNPVSDILHIISETDFSARLFDLNGRLVCNRTNELFIDMAPMERGVYLLEITAGGETTRHKIIRE